MANFKSLIITPLFITSLLAFNPVLAAANNSAEPSSSMSEVEAEKLNVNTASFEQLIALKGIGPAKAQAILDYIDAHGDLVSLDELLEIRGIGQRLLAKLKLQLSL